MNIIEKVAISQSEFDGRPWMSMPKGERNRYMERARAAIEAMVNPTDDMVEKGANGMCYTQDMTFADMCRFAWRDMIDEALQSQKGN